MSGLKNVRRRHRDELSRLRWDRLEALLAAHYRDQGYTVDHCGTGANGRRFDGGVDLRLRREDACVLVQCKHWNAKQVPHNAVHELLGAMVNEGATGAVLVTSGEFTRAAREAAARHGHVQLVDGTALRAMLGPLPEPASSVFDWLALAATRDAGRVGAGVARVAGERLWSAAEDRVWRSAKRTATGWGMSVMEVLLLKVAGLVFLVLVGWFALRLVERTIEALVEGPRARVAVTTPVTPRPMSQPLPMRHASRATPAPMQASAACHDLIDARSGTYIDHCQPRRVAGPDPATIRAQQRRADEAMDVIRHSTPEM